MSQDIEEQKRIRRGFLKMFGPMYAAILGPIGVAIWVYFFGPFTFWSLDDLDSGLLAMFSSYIAFALLAVYLVMRFLPEK